ncbi:urease accessory protein UreF [Rhizobium sp. CC-YZS058]|uniref:urease accessory protein UreF n=1 Tax=Rhizobium sp. CC-YZS058 TaxID=3042153 RepID=UPI002B05A6BC|nr:urease accessory UreF family protein [Rhizobium sp. CC-YZS058]MEA3536660.1 urease accessory UreF family protein [Rhizobium sp. CC-YZS058]
MQVFDTATTLGMLQFGDSAYPAGGFAFSWGIEGLAADGLIASPEDFDRTLAQQLRLRWNSFDRIVVARGFACETIDAVERLDRSVEAATLSMEMREGSKRAGRALLGISARSGGEISQAYRQRLSLMIEPLGHLPVMQALVYRDAGLPADATALLSGWTMVMGLTSAAIRLGTIGHVQAQASLARARRLLEDLLLVPPPVEEPASFTPFSDIAVSRGPWRHVRMFST